jgi:hypothetical protein
MTSSAPRTLMTLVNALRPLRLLLVVILIGVILGVLERQQTSRHGHLSPYEAGSVPQLHGAFLSNFAQQAFELSPEEVQPNLLMGMSLAEQGRGKEARAHLERALAIDRNDPQLLFFYAQVLHALGEDPKAVQQIRDELKQKFPQDWTFAQSEFERVDRERALSHEKQRG